MNPRQVWLVVQQEFRIRFALGELEGLKDVGDMVDLMQKKLAR